MQSTGKFIAAGLLLGWALTASSSALASLMIVQTNTGTNNPNLGGYDMVSVPLGPGGTTSSSISLTGITGLSGSIDIEKQDGTPLSMYVTSAKPSWWAYDHGSVYTTTTNWIELALPANVRAISFHVGSKYSATGWIEAFDGNGDGLTNGNANGGSRQAFNLGPGNTPGFGIYSSDPCGSISRVVIEPLEWGFGNLALEQGNCTQVPEPSAITLLAAALLGLGLIRLRFRPALIRGRA